MMDSYFMRRVQISNSASSTFSANSALENRDNTATEATEAVYNPATTEMSVVDRTEYYKQLILNGNIYNSISTAWSRQGLNPYRFLNEEGKCTLEDDDQVILDVINLAHNGHNDWHGNIVIAPIPLVTPAIAKLILEILPNAGVRPDEMGDFDFTTVDFDLESDGNQGIISGISDDLDGVAHHYHSVYNRTANDAMIARGMHEDFNGGLRTAALEEGIRGVNNLSSLHLSGNSIGDPGAIFIAEEIGNINIGKISSFNFNDNIILGNNITLTVNKGISIDANSAPVVIDSSIFGSGQLKFATLENLSVSNNYIEVNDIEFNSNPDSLESDNEDGNHADTESIVSDSYAESEDDRLEISLQDIDYIEVQELVLSAPQNTPIIGNISISDEELNDFVAEDQES